MDCSLGREWSPGRFSITAAHTVPVSASSLESPKTPVKVRELNEYREFWAMEEYISEALAQHFICPSTSPAASSFFRKWPQPSNVRGLQHFPGFGNFYQSFIANFSSISSPLISMISMMSKSLSWSTDALLGFQRLKEALCSTPTLCQM